MCLRRSTIFTAMAASMLLASGVALAAPPAVFAQKGPIAIPDSAASAGAASAVSVIKKSGSYVLTRNITIKKAGMDGVDVTVPNVTIDLQGFTINAAPGIATGTGINAAGRNQVTIKNGFITGMGGQAVVVGAQSTVSDVNATGDSTSGSAPVIQAQAGSLIVNNTVVGGLAVGISCGSACLVRGNILQNNSSFGIQLSDTSSGYAGNILQGNNGTSLQISGGTQIGQNLCNGSLCP